MACPHIRRAVRGAACCTCKLNNATRTRVFCFALIARDAPNHQRALPEIMPVKTELDYAVSTGIGERRCYAEACIQTHLLWLIEEGKVERIKERNQVRFLSNIGHDGEQE